ncbi:glycosyltransferase family 2 protein [Gilvimarinus xylanilyticus]|uniref:Glycosyltransferase n=1 Tax=Gilvimarinus xylanilyticus TaxID=2944139 RepID=A0A9X2HY78_9GAMM|nr:glycosyltransferase [Gilvimarinus xylanilyticus]MCP8900220.1 glycosyltransferase [Gilvimarinus xylanilyticus]
MLSVSPKVSVVIPVFNDLAGLDRCLAALKSQSVPDEMLEVIVIDNGSKVSVSIDSSSFDFLVKVFSCFVPGSFAARNLGVKKARGEVIAFIDADCWPERNWLAKGFTKVQEKGGAAFIAGEAQLVMPENPSSIALYQCLEGFDQRSNVYDRQFSCTLNMFAEKRAFDVVGGFDERLFSGGDREWCWRAIRLGFEIDYEPEALVYTLPRNSFGSAIRQVRRVVGGRRSLSSLGLSHLGEEKLQKKRTFFQAVKWILIDNDLSFLDSVRVLFVAIVLRTVGCFELFRLFFGGAPERR